MSTRSYYEILGVSRNASQKEIKKAYHKIALQEFPDKLRQKLGREPTTEETRKANDRAYEVNKAYEVLSDINKRNLYNINPRAFESDGYGNDYDNDEDYQRERAEAEEEEFREDRIRDVKAYFCFSGCGKPKHEFENPPLDPNLWLPYSSWMEKMRKISHNEVCDFVSQLFRAADEFQKKREEEWQKEYDEIGKNRKFNERFDEENNNFHNVDKGKVGDEIIAKLKSRGVSDSDLDSSLWSPYQLWVEKLVSLSSESEIENFKNQMFNAINKAKSRKQNQNNDRQKPTNHYPTTNQNPNKNDKKKTDLVAEINKLKQEIEKLKVIKNKSPAQQSELSEKENKLRKLEMELKGNNSDAQKPKSDNNFPISLVIGGGILLVAGLVVVLMIKKQRTKKIKSKKWKK